MAIRKPCVHPGCKNFAEDGKNRCAKHWAIHEEKLKAREQERDKRRGSARERGYGKRWKEIRDWKIKKDRLCEFCLEKKPQQITLAECVHHIDENPRNNKYENLKSACFDCHERHHGRKK